MNEIRVPPIKCQGIKTKIVPLIKSNIFMDKDSIWYEPFMGSGVVGFNIAPKVGRFSDINPHLINFYNAIKSSAITPNIARRYLEEEGGNLLAKGEKHYYFIRERFNDEHKPLDFLFLSRSCFNGMIRFNKKGSFNVPFCRKTNRFSRSYITKIVNQIECVYKAFSSCDWTFECLEFDEALLRANQEDFIYCDPPYLGRHVDYFDSWDEKDEYKLHTILSDTEAKFILSTWHSNRYRENTMLKTLWAGFHIVTKKHFYHIGASEENRNDMLEALVMNFIPHSTEIRSRQSEQLPLFMEETSGIGF